MSLERSGRERLMMKTWVVVASSDRAEAVRRALRRSGHLRTDIRALRSAQEVAFPVRSAPRPLPEHTRIEEREITPASRPPRSYRDLLHLPPQEQAVLPRAFDVIGDVVLVRLPTRLKARASEIGTALLAFVPGARRVGWDQGVRGEARLRKFTPLAGVGPWRTVHKENGLEFIVDPEVAYFSPRLAGEHARVASEVGPAERVFDLCCGIGPFALTIASRGTAAQVVAVDSNPGAISLLRENARQMGLSSRIESRNEPLELFLTTAARADRAILNLPHDGVKYLPSVSAAIAPGGTLHYYEVTPRQELGVRGSGLLGQLQPAGVWRCTESRRVHPYSPQADLVAYTLRRR
jgi:tRNA (guanine37-N1)-methyltransferase